MKDYCDNISLHDNAIHTPFLDDGLQIVSLEQIGYYEVVDALSKDKLEHATSFTYCCNYNGDPWNFNMECEVSNKGIKANVIINFGIDFAEQYVFDSPIGNAEYKDFLSNMASQNMMNVIFKNNDSEEELVDDSLAMASSFMIMDGIQSSSLIVMCDKDVLFKSDASENLYMTKGQLGDSFIMFLPQYMKDAILNPEKFLNDCKPSVPPSCRLDDSAVDIVDEDEEDIAYLAFDDNSANSDDEYLV